MVNPLNKKEFLSNVNRAIESLMSKGELSVQSIADIINMSPQKLRRTLKNASGLSCTDYIENYKLHYAQKLLIEYDLVTIAKVGEMCGFEEPTHFSRFFKRRCGMSPSEFRKSKKAGGA